MADPRKWADAFVAQASEDLVAAQAAFEAGAVRLDLLNAPSGEQLQRSLAGVAQGLERHRRLAHHLAPRLLEHRHQRERVRRGSR